jgi:hypothetical protein
LPSSVPSRSPKKRIGRRRAGCCSWLRACAWDAREAAAQRAIGRLRERSIIRYSCGSNSPPTQRAHPEKADEPLDAIGAALHYEQHATHDRRSHGRPAPNL